MKWSVLGLIVMGLVAAVSASMLVGALLTPSEPVVDHSEAVNVLVAARDMTSWTTVTLEDIVIRTIDRSETPESYFTSVTQVLGRTLSRDIVAGAPFGKSSFRSDQWITIPKGHRLMALTLPPDAALKGLLEVGCFVDVLVSSGRMHRSNFETTTLLENVRVRAINDDITPDQNRDSSTRGSNVLTKKQQITLIVTPDQAEKLRSAMSDGDLSLALRNPDEPNPPTAPPGADPGNTGIVSAQPAPQTVRKGNLLAALWKMLPASAPRTESKPRVHKVEVINGRDIQIREFPIKNEEITQTRKSNWMSMRFILGLIAGHRGPAET